MNTNLDIKVALVSHGFSPYAFGGVGPHCYDLAYSLSEIGIETAVFCGKSDKVTMEKLNNQLTVIRLPLLNKPPRHLWFQLQNLNALLKLLRKFTVLHGQGMTSAICTYLARRLKKPLVSTIHDVPLMDLYAFLKAPISEWAIGDFAFNVLEYPLNHCLTRIALKGSDQIITCGRERAHQIKNVYRNLNIKNISVIQNGINFDKIDNIKKHSDSAPKLQDKLTIFFCGRLYWKKGVFHLIKAMNNLKREFKDIELKIFGEGPCEHEMRRLVLRLGLKNYVRFQGYVPYPELILALEKADVAVFPSFLEIGAFISALEAMACKKAPVVFDFPFTREFIRHMYNGLLAKPADIKDLSDKIYLLLSDRKLRNELGRNAYEYVKKAHNWRLLVKKYIKVYEKVTQLSYKTFT